MNQPRIFRSAIVPFGAGPHTALDRDAGVITDLVMCQPGEAKGHGVHLEDCFIDRLVELATPFNEVGLKCRFGHPAMCSESLGTYMGRLKNWRKNENGQAIADLYFDPSASISPTHGNMQEWVFARAENSGDQCGFSIVFASEYIYHYDDDGKIVKDWSPDDRPTYIFPKELYGADLVDEPAATTGMFNTGLPAQALSEFLDLHPEVYELYDSKPELLDIFMNKYREYKASRKPSSTPPTPTPVLSMPKSKPKKRGFFSQIIAAFQSFAIAATTTDGVGITIDTEESTPAVGDSVYITDTGEPAPDGTHTISGGDLDGTTIVTEGGVITEIPESEPSPAADPPMNNSSSQQVEELQRELSALRSRLQALEQEPAADPPPARPVADNTATGDRSLSDTPWNSHARKVFNRRTGK